MNLYGFAGGDPVNFSDPFGLCPIEKDGIPCMFTMGLVGAGTGALTGAAAGAAGGTLVIPGVGTVVGAGGGALAGGGIGLIAGSAAGATADIVSMFGQGLSWWDKMRVKINIIIGAALTQGELKQRQTELEKAKQEQTEATKQEKKKKEGGTPPDGGSSP